MLKRTNQFFRGVGEDDGDRSLSAPPKGKWCESTEGTRTKESLDFLTGLTCRRGQFSTCEASLPVWPLLSLDEELAARER
jgi:hypothetical protein